MKISKDIGTIKQAHNMPIYQPHRWQQVLDRQMQAARELGLDEEFVRELTEKIHGESLRMQK
jgi:chorismate mutase